jgi:hypothetical protein
MTTRELSNQNGRWLSIREASLALGTSELTIRRRIKDGKLHSKLDGGKYYVLLGERPAPPEAPVESEGVVAASASPALGSLDLGHVLAEQARLAEAAGKAELLAEQLSALEARYAALQDGALALANRNGWLESKLEEREQEIKLLEDSRRRRPWWRRVLTRE